MSFSPNGNVPIDPFAKRKTSGSNGSNGTVVTLPSDVLGAADDTVTLPGGLELGTEKPKNPWVDPFDQTNRYYDTNPQAGRQDQDWGRMSTLPLQSGGGAFDTIDGRIKKLNDAMAKADEQMQGFNRWQMPTSFTKFGETLGEQERTIRGFSDFETPQEFTNFSQSLEDAQSLLTDLTGQGSFGPGGFAAPGGGQLGEAARMAGILEGDIGDLADLVPDLGQGSGLAGQIGEREEQLKALQDQAAGLNLEDFYDLLTGGATGLDELQAQATGLDLDAFDELRSGAGTGLDDLQAQATGLDLNAFDQLRRGAATGLEDLQTQATDLNLGRLPAEILRADEGLGGISDLIGSITGGLPGLTEGLGLAGEAADPLTNLLGQIQSGAFDAESLQGIFDDIGINLPGQDISGGVREALGLKPGQDFASLLPEVGPGNVFNPQIDIGGGGLDEADFRRILGDVIPNQFGGVPEGLLTEDTFLSELEKLRGTDAPGAGEDFEGFGDDFFEGLAKRDFETPDIGTDTDDFLQTLQDAITGRLGEDPLGSPSEERVREILAEAEAMGEDLSYQDALSRAHAEGLRADPQTAALLAELSKRGDAEKRERMEELNRLGVLRSGDTAEALGDLSGEMVRGELDILGQALERARLDRESATTQGVGLGGTLSGREIGLGEMFGQLGGKQTLGGRQADLDLISTALASLDPDLRKGRKDIDFNMLAQAILAGLGGGGLDLTALRNAIGKQKD